MSCYKPLKAYMTSQGVVFQKDPKYGLHEPLALPCGRCIGCRMDRAEDWTLRIMHEASLWWRNSFITLTYADENLPARGSLDYGHFKLFMRRVIHAYGPVRYYMCGEYGPLNLRPHYHACMFNCDFDPNTWKVAGKSASGAVFFTSTRLSELWPYGHATVQYLVPETAGYCARYVMKKALGDDAETKYSYTCPRTGEIFLIEPETARMSLKPGIGAGWYEKYGVTDAHRHDFVVRGGVRKKVPKYYDKLLKRRCEATFDVLKLQRVERAVEHAADNTPERLRAKEIVHEAKLTNHLRSFSK